MKIKGDKLNSAKGKERNYTCIFMISKPYNKTLSNKDKEQALIFITYSCLFQYQNQSMEANS